MNLPKRFLSVTVFFCLWLLALPACAQTARSVSFSDIEKLPKPPADARVAYGSDPLQFGDLRLPKTKGLHPVVIVIHGGCWYAEYDLNHLAAFCDALTKAGVATWSLEYRRIGDKGGAWPGTFLDVAKGADHLRELAKKYPLDLSRVIAVGHSAGGQLALWLAARSQLKQDSPLYSPDPLKLSGVVGLAAVTDLRKFRPNCGDSVTKLLGGAPEQFVDRYAQTSPLELLPLKTRQVLIHGARDGIVPLQLGKDYEAAAKQKGDDVTLLAPEQAGHFELISPQSATWMEVEKTVLKLLTKK